MFITTGESKKERVKKSKVKVGRSSVGRFSYYFFLMNQLLHTQYVSLYLIAFDRQYEVNKNFYKKRKEKKKCDITFFLSRLFIGFFGTELHFHSFSLTCEM